MSRKRPAALLVSLVATCVATHTVYASSTSLPSGARPLGMGGAFTAVADDASTAMYNPAGLARIGEVQLDLTRTALFSAPTDPLVSQDSAHLVLPLGQGSAVAGATSLADRDGIYRKTTVVTGYGAAIGRRLTVGLLAKWLRVGLADVADVTQNPYFADTTSTSAMTLDIGLLLEPLDGWSIGLAAQDLVPPDLAFQEATDVVAEEPPQTVRIGTAYRLAKIASAAEQASLGQVLERSLIAVDVALGNGTTIGAGVELGLSDALTGRIGYRSASGRGESSSAVTLGGSIGFHVDDVLVHADYAADVANTRLEDNISQRLSLRASF